MSSLTAAAKDYYSYVVKWSGLAAGASSPQQIQFDADSDFVWQKATYFADIAAAGETESSQVIPLCTVTMQDLGSGRFLTSNPVPIGAYFGIGVLPFILPQPKVFVARSALQITLTNYDASNTYNVYVAFIGTKVFKS